MKIVSKSIKMIALFEYEDNPPMPYKFKIMEDGQEITVKVHKCLYYEKKRIAGIECIVYRCQSVINGVMRLYELKYIIKDCRWKLYKL